LSDTHVEFMLFCTSSDPTACEGDYNVVQLDVNALFRIRSFSSYTQTEDTPVIVRTCRDISQKLYGLLAFDHQAL
jgi:hypothetical protein